MSPRKRTRSAKALAAIASPSSTKKKKTSVKKASKKSTTKKRKAASTKKTSTKASPAKKAKATPAKKASTKKASSRASSRAASRASTPAKKASTKKASSKRKSTAKKATPKRATPKRSARKSSVKRAIASTYDDDEDDDEDDSEDDYRGYDVQLRAQPRRRTMTGHINARTLNTSAEADMPASSTGADVFNNNGDGVGDNSIGMDGCGTMSRLTRALPSFLSVALLTHALAVVNGNGAVRASVSTFVTTYLYEGFDVDAVVGGVLSVAGSVLSPSPSPALCVAATTAVMYLVASWTLARAGVAYKSVAPVVTFTYTLLALVSICFYAAAGDGGHGAKDAAGVSLMLGAGFAAYEVLYHCCRTSRAAMLSHLVDLYAFAVVTGTMHSAVADFTVSSSSAPFNVWNRVLPECCHFTLRNPFTGDDDERAALVLAYSMLLTSKMMTAVSHMLGSCPRLRAYTHVPTSVFSLLLLPGVYTLLTLSPCFVSATGLAPLSALTSSVTLFYAVRTVLEMLAVCACPAFAACPFNLLKCCHGGNAAAKGKKASGGGKCPFAFLTSFCGGSKRD